MAIWPRCGVTLHQPESQLAFANGERAVVVSLRMAQDHRIDLWSARVDTMLAQLQQDLPDNIGLVTSFDQQRYTDQRLDTLLINIVQGFLIIVAVLLVTLGVKAAIIVALSLPLTVAFSFACMNLINLPIHQMSVTGLVVALGIMVDNAIVMADRVQYQRRHGMAMSGRRTGSHRPPLAATAGLHPHYHARLYADHSDAGPGRASLSAASPGR